MANQVMRDSTTISRSKGSGCLRQLIVFILVFAACYWLLLAPMNPTQNQPQISGQVFVDGQLSAIQRAALDQLVSISDSPVQVLAQDGAIRFFSGNISVPDSVAMSPQEKALFFLEQQDGFFQLGDPGRNLRLIGQSDDDHGRHYVRFRQIYLGVPIYGTDIIVGVNAEDQVFSVSGGYAPNFSIDVQPVVRSIEAERTALADLDDETAVFAESTQLVIYAPQVWGAAPPSNPPRLAWLVSLSAAVDSEISLYFLDAIDGSILAKEIGIADLDGGLDLEIWDANDGPSESAVQVMDENGPISTGPGGVEITSEDARNAFDFIQVIYRYYAENFEHAGYNDNGAPVIVYVRTPPKCNHWNGDLQRIVICSGWAENIDIFAHEFMHGIVAHTAQFGPQGEPRALDESFADLSAVFLDQNEEQRWIIAKFPHISEGSIHRNLENPPDDYPRHYSEIYCSRNISGCCPEELNDSYKDCGHVNSVLFSYAAYLAAEGVDQEGVEIDAITVQRLQYIYFYALKHGLGESSVFKQAAFVVLDSCQTLTKPNEYDDRITISQHDCDQLKKAFISTGLIEAEVENQPPGSGWDEVIRFFLRGLIDQLLGNLREQIAELAEDILDNVEDAIKDYLKILLEEKLRELFESLLQWLYQICSGVGVPVVPTGALILLKRRRQLRKKPPFRQG